MLDMSPEIGEEAGVAPLLPTTPETEPAQAGSNASSAKSKSKGKAKATQVIEAEATPYLRDVPIVPSLAPTSPSAPVSAAGPVPAPLPDLWPLLESTGSALALAGPDGRFLRANAPFCAILGYTEEQLRAFTPAGILHPADAPGAAGSLQDFFAGTTAACRVMSRCVRRDASILWAGLSLARVLGDEAGPDAGMALCVLTDLTAARLAEAELNRVRGRYATALDGIDECVYITGPQGQITFAGGATKRLLGFAASYLEGKSLLDIVDPADQSHVRTALERAILAGAGGGPSTQTFKALLATGAYVWVEAQFRPLAEDDGPVSEVVSIWRSVREREQLRKPAVPAALFPGSTVPRSEKHAPALHTADGEEGYDPLTGVLDKESIEAVLAGRLKSQRASSFPVGCLLLDVDRFGQVVARHGGEAGDELLKRIAAILRLMCRAEDYVGRFDADSFVLVLPNTNAAGTITVGEKLLRSVACADWPSIGIEQEVTVSIGATCLVQGMTLELDDLLEILQSQLEQAKAAGRNRVIMNTRQMLGRDA